MEESPRLSLSLTVAQSANTPHTQYPWPDAGLSEGVPVNGPLLGTKDFSAGKGGFPAISGLGDTRHRFLTRRPIHFSGLPRYLRMLPGCEGTGCTGAVYLVALEEVQG